MLIHTRKGRSTGVERRSVHRHCCRNKKTMRHCIPDILMEASLSFEDPLYVCKRTGSWLLCLSPELPFMLPFSVVCWRGWVTPVRLLLKCVVLSCWVVDEMLVVRISILVKWFNLYGLGTGRFDKYHISFPEGISTIHDSWYKLPVITAVLQF